MVIGVNRKTRRYRSVRTRTHFSWIRFGTSYKSEHSVYTHCPKRPKLRGMLANQDDKGSLQKPHWRSRTLSRKVWSFDDSRSHSSQRGRWISKQLPIRSRGTSFCHSMDSILSVQNNNFPGDGKEFTKVSRAVRIAESHSHWQLIEIWHLLWRFYHEIVVHQHFIGPRRMVLLRSGTQSKRRNVCCIVAIRLGWKMWADSMECYCYLRNVQDLLADGKTLHERRFAEPFVQ